VVLSGFIPIERSSPPKENFSMANEGLRLENETSQFFDPSFWV